MPETKMTVNGHLLMTDRVDNICTPYGFVALRNVSSRGGFVDIGNLLYTRNVAGAGNAVGSKANLVPALPKFSG